MPAAVRMRTDYSAHELWRLAATTKNANQTASLTVSFASAAEGDPASSTGIAAASG